MKTPMFVVAFLLAIGSLASSGCVSYDRYDRGVTIYNGIPGSTFQTSMNNGSSWSRSYSFGESAWMPIMVSGLGGYYHGEVVTVIKVMVPGQSPVLLPYRQTFSGDVNYIWRDQLVLRGQGSTNGVYLDRSNF